MINYHQLFLEKMKRMTDILMFLKFLSSILLTYIVLAACDTDSSIYEDADTFSGFIKSFQIAGAKVFWQLDGKLKRIQPKKLRSLT